MPTIQPSPQVTKQNLFNPDGTPKNPLDAKEEPQKDVEAIYNETDKDYLSFLQHRLESAKRQNDQGFPEFDGKSRLQYYEENEKIANTNHLEPKKNSDDVVISAGTIEAKLDALLSNINGLNLGSEVLSFDREKNKIVELGQIMEDIIFTTKTQDGADGAGDEEKKMGRQRELLKQGTVYVQEEWCRRFETKKRLKQKYNGEFKGFAGFDSKLEVVFDGPSSTQLYGLNFYHGDVTEFYMDKQPYIFVVIKQSHELTESKYGKFENFKFVKKGQVSIDNDEAKTIFDNKWRLTDVAENQDEIIMYQDGPRDEFQILINGVLMLPIGFPLSAVSPKGGYNIAKQVFRILNDKFAFGGSFVSSGSVKEISAIIDEMLRLFVLKTRKSFTPSYINTSGRVIDKRVLSPGRISMGIDPQALVPIGQEGQGVTVGELGVLKQMQELINQSTVSEQFTGQQGKSGTTATEVVELQRQARLSLGLAITVCSLLEKKLDYLRLYNILANWFEPLDTRVKELGRLASW